MWHPSTRRLKGGSGEPQAREPDLDTKAGYGTDHSERDQPGGQAQQAHVHGRQVLLDKPDPTNFLLTALLHYWRFSIPLGLLLIVFREAALKCDDVAMSGYLLFSLWSLLRHIVDILCCKLTESVDIFSGWKIQWDAITSVAALCTVIWESVAIKTAISFLPSICWFFFCRNLLISFSDYLLWLAFNASYPTECLSSTSLQLYKRMFILLLFQEKT